MNKKTDQPTTETTNKELDPNGAKGDSMSPNDTKAKKDKDGVAESQPSVPRASDKQPGTKTAPLPNEAKREERLAAAEAAKASRAAFQAAIKRIKPKDVLYATGRRKTSSARVYMRLGKGRIQVNQRAFEEYFPRQAWRLHVMQPLIRLGAEEQFDVRVTVRSGGISGQAGAIRHGIARILAQYDKNRNLRKAGLLTRDARIVERKKIGLHKARKRPQYSKR